MEQEQKPNWIEQEQAQLPTQTEFVKVPAVKLEENKVAELVLDFSKPFEKWTDPETKKVKAIIPCKEQGVDKNFWLNIQNPVYREILAAGKSGQTVFKIMQTGTQKKTKYILVK